MGSSGGNAETALALSAVAATGGKSSKLLFQTECSSSQVKSAEEPDTKIHDKTKTLTLIRQGFLVQHI